MSVVRMSFNIIKIFLVVRTLKSRILKIFALSSLQ